MENYKRVFLFFLKNKNEEKRLRTIGDAKEVENLHWLTTGNMTDLTPLAKQISRVSSLSGSDLKCSGQSSEIHASSKERDHM